VRQFVCKACGVRFERPRKPGRPPTVCSPECRAEDNRGRARAWYHANPTRVAQQPSRASEHRKRVFAEWYAANRQEEIRRALRWARDNPESKRATDARRYALTRGSTEAERFTLDEIFERDQAICHLCLQRVPRSQATMDHVVPVTKGGPHTRANVKLAHRSCNARKGNRLLAA